MPATRSSTCRRFLLRIGLLGLLAALAAACTGPTAPPPAQQAPAPTGPKAGGTLVFGVAQDLDNLNPVLQGFNVSGLVSDAVYDPLVRLGADDQYHPALATEVPSLENGGIARDGLTYTFTLHKGVTFHDGQPLTCKDVQYTWAMGKDPTVKVIFKDEFAAVSSVTCTDEHTAVFRLARPYPSLLNVSAKYGILPKHLYEKEDFNTSALNLKPVGSGPFVFKEYVKGSHVLLERNPGYFRGRPHLDGVVVKIVLDVNALLAQVEKGEVDVWWRAAAASAPTIKALRDWELIARPVLGQEFLAFNLSGDPRLADKRVRQALAHAIDRDAIINTVYLGYAEPNPASPLVPTHWIFKKDVTDYKHDPERAKALLDEAGWRVGPDGVRARDGQRLAFELQAAGNDRVKSAELVGSQFKQIGVETRIKTGTSATLYKEAQDGRFELRLTPYTQPFETDVRFLLYTGALENIGKWSHTEADKLMDEAAATLDPEKRKLLYDRVQEIFADELPYFPLFQTTNLYAVKKSVHNYRPNPNILNAISDFWNSYEWWKD